MKKKELTRKQRRQKKRKLIIVVVGLVILISLFILHLCYGIFSPVEDIFVDNNPVASLNEDNAPVTFIGGDYDISQWGLAGSIIGSYSIQYSINHISGHSQEAMFTSSDLVGACKGEVVGYISRYDSNYIMEGEERGTFGEGVGMSVEQYYDNLDQKDFWKKIGDNYYRFTRPRMVCDLMQTSIGDEVEILFHSLYAE